MLISDLAARFLDWCDKHRAPATHGWYRGHLTSFLTHLGTPLPATDLKPFHVVDWTDCHPGWGSNYRRGAMLALQRALNWAVEMGYLAASPIKALRKPPASRRDNPLTPTTFQTLLAHIRECDPFRDLLLFCWHTGARPQEARHLEPRHVDLAAEQVVIPQKEAKCRGRPRVILLDSTALGIIRRLLADCTEGKLFRNSRGRPWTKYAVGNRFHRLASRSGVRCCMYDLRHSFCQRLLERGVNHLAVAELLGHANGQMVSTVYSHMNRAQAHLREALKKAST